MKKGQLNMRNKEKRRDDKKIFGGMIFSCFVGGMAMAGIIAPAWASQRQTVISNTRASTFYKEENQILYVEKLDPKKISEDGPAPVAIEVAVALPEEIASEDEALNQEKSYTEEELDVMAHLLCGEVQSGSWNLQVATGSVVLNRVKSKKYPNSIKEVVFQKGQYACTWDGNYYRTPTERNWQVAEYLLENGSQIPDNVIYQAQFRQGKGVWQKIGSETFCYE